MAQSPLLPRALTAIFSQPLLKLAGPPAYCKGALGVTVLPLVSRLPEQQVWLYDGYHPPNTSTGQPPLCPTCTSHRHLLSCFLACFLLTTGLIHPSFSIALHSLYFCPRLGSFCDYPSDQPVSFCSSCFHSIVSSSDEVTSSPSWPDRLSASVTRFFYVSPLCGGSATGFVSFRLVVPVTCLLVFSCLLKFILLIAFPD